MTNHTLPTTMMTKRYYIRMAMALLTGMMLSTGCAMAQNGTPASKKGMTPTDSLKLMLKKQKEEKKLKAVQAKWQRAADKEQQKLDALQRHQVFSIGDSLAGVADSLRKDSARAEAARQQVARMVKDSLDKRTADYDRKHAGDSLTVLKQRAMVEKLKRYQASYRENLVKAPDSVWLPKTFEQTNVYELEEECSLYTGFTGDTLVAASAARMDSLLADARIYYKGKQALREPYNKAELSRDTALLATLREHTADSLKRAEIDLLVASLAGYGEKVKRFQKVIRLVNEEQELVGEIKKGTFELLVKNLADDVKSLKTIPWLADQYELYSGFYKKGTTREVPEIAKTIANLKP